MHTFVKKPGGDTGHHPSGCYQWIIDVTDPAVKLLFQGHG